MSEGGQKSEISKDFLISTIDLSGIGGTGYHSVKAELNPKVVNPIMIL